MPWPGPLCLFRKVSVAVALSMLWSLSAPGQADTIAWLEEIEVTAQRINLTDVGKHSEALDSQGLAMRQYNSLSNQLSFLTPLYVRSYGNGTLATLGIRGGSAAHTQLLWNGIPLRNPMLGLVDLALIPALFTDEVSIHYGGHGSAFGSGAVGGLISFSNDRIAHEDGLQLHLSAGSWDNFLGELKATYGFSKLRFSTRIFGQSGENNYRYKLDENTPERNQVHHELRNTGILQEAMWDISDQEQVTARVWYQYADRQIPPLSTQTTSKAAQQDESLRATLQWMRNGEKFSWQCKTAWLNESIHYQDSLILLYTENKFHTWLAEASTSVRMNPAWTFTGGLYAELVSASSANYDTGTARNQYAAFTSLGWITGDWVLRLQLREEITGSKWSPLLSDVSAEWSGIKNWTIKSSVSRNYRVPTLNDLYWRPGGNPELVPETGWTFEAGLHYKNRKKTPAFTSSLTAFTRKIDEWIMWLPPIPDVRNYWSPVNISEVWSRGFEFRGNLVIHKQDWTFALNAGADLTWSTFGQPIPDFKIEEGDQLFYVPVETVMAGFRVTHSHWTGYYTHHWFGGSPGINEDVDSGNVGSAGLNYIFTSHKVGCTLYLQADNVWNVPYRLIERRPMPGRSFTGGVRLTFS